MRGLLADRVFTGYTLAGGFAFVTLLFAYISASPSRSRRSTARPRRPSACSSDSLCRPGDRRPDQRQYRLAGSASTRSSPSASPSSPSPRDLLCSPRSLGEAGLVPVAAALFVLMSAMGLALTAQHPGAGPDAGTARGRSPRPHCWHLLLPHRRHRLPLPRRHRRGAHRGPDGRRPTGGGTGGHRLLRGTVPSLADGTHRGRKGGGQLSAPRLRVDTRNGPDSTRRTRATSYGTSCAHPHPVGRAPGRRASCWSRAAARSSPSRRWRAGPCATPRTTRRPTPGSNCRPDRRPMTVHTPFDLASLTKLFTAVAAVQQLERGTLGIDARVGAYLPEFRAACAHDITVRQLLTHTSGLRPELPRSPPWTTRRASPCCGPIGSCPGRAVRLLRPEPDPPPTRPGTRHRPHARRPRPRRDHPAAGMTATSFGPCEGAAATEDQRRPW